MNSSSSYAVELKGQGLQLTRDLSEEQAHELLLWLVKGGKLDSAGSDHKPAQNRNVAPGETLQPPPSDLPTSVREFIDQFEPKRVPDRIACFGLYLRKHRQKNEFSKADVVSLFQEAAEPLPKNLGRDLRWTQSIAWIAPSATNRESFYLTKKGEDAVRSKFSKEMVAKTKLPAGPQRRRTNAVEITSDENPHLSQ
jgi:hypothetical protein